jgi:uncharacterized membrane protein
MLDFLVYHLADITVYPVAAAIVFIIARSASAGTALALVLAVVPVSIAWLMVSPMAHSLLGVP